MLELKTGMISKAPPEKWQRILYNACTL